MDEGKHHVQGQITNMVTGFEVKCSPEPVSTPGSSRTHTSQPFLFCFLGKNTPPNMFLSTHITEGLACINYGPVSSATAQVT